MDKNRQYLALNPLEDILRTITKDVQWLSDIPLQEKTGIAWVTLSLQNVQTGDLILLDPSSEITIDDLFQIKQQGASAVAILGQWVPPASLAAIRLPFCLLHSDKDVRTVHRQMLTTVLSKKASAVEQGLSIQIHLTEIAARGEGLTGLVFAMREITRHSILVQDKRLAPLASSPTEDLRPAWDSILDHLTTFPLLPEYLRDRRQAVEKSAVHRQTLPGGLERVVVPVVAGDVARGYLSIVAQTGELDSTDFLTAEQGALVCAVDMARAKAVRETEKRLHGDLLAALLNRNLSARDAHLWAQNIGLDLEQQHAAARISWEGTSASIRRLETIVNGEISRRRLAGFVSQMGNEIICFCQISRDSTRPEAAINLGQEIIDTSRHEYPEAVIRMGIGVPARQMSDWQLSFRQAGQALSMAHRLDERLPLYYMDLSVYRLLLQIEDHPDLRAFLQETLGNLIQHEHCDDFLKTLEQYFFHNGNLSQTADALSIHRNTLIYRMDRIAAAGGFDLNLGDTRLAVQLALRIHRMLQSVPSLPAQNSALP